MKATIIGGFGDESGDVASEFVSIPSVFLLGEVSQVLVMVWA